MSDKSPCFFCYSLGKESQEGRSSALWTGVVEEKFPMGYPLRLQLVLRPFLLDQDAGLFTITGGFNYLLLFSCTALIWFWNQSNVDLIKRVWKFSFFKEEKILGNIFLEKIYRHYYFYYYYYVW